MKRWHRVALAVAAVLVIVPVVLAVFFYASMSGGWDDAFRRKKDASHRDVREARKRAEPVVAEQARELRLEPEPYREHCAEGQHNWKIDNDFDVSCELLATAAMQVPDRLEPRMHALHDQLTAAGWRPGAGGGIPNTLMQYRDSPRGLPSVTYERDADSRLVIEWPSSTDVELTLRYRFYEG